MRLFMWLFLVVTYVLLITGCHELQSTLSANPFPVDAVDVDTDRILIWLGSALATLVTGTYLGNKFPKKK